MTIDRVATAARTSACRLGSMDELMVFAVRSDAIPSPTAPGDRRVKTDERTPKSVPLSVGSRSDRAANRQVIPGVFLNTDRTPVENGSDQREAVSDPISVDRAELTM